ncbi:MAG: TonB-dependent receptor [Acidobacteriota bacterium]|nr:TonB-dependent receptor [Acidobacteriota bacterium]
MKRSLVPTGLLLLVSAWASAQQTGSIAGTVTTDNGEGLPGVVISAQGNTLPQPRETVTAANGKYRFNLLPPGEYELTFVMTGMTTVKKKAGVFLEQKTTVDVTMSAGTAEQLTVVGRQDLVDTTSTELKAAVDNEVFEALPLGNEYRDLVKLIPGVQVTANSVRGPSAGGSGQDNLYRFDGVDVTLPLFGTLSSEPSSHDIAQVSVVKGGAQAVGFNRSGGFTINSVSRSGTNQYTGEVSYKIQPDSFEADPDVPPTALEGKTEQTWAVIGFGGPIAKDRLFFYGSYYAPTVDRTDRSNAYGVLPDGKSERDEIFAKLTWSPLSNLTMHASLRDSSREFTNSTVFSVSAPTVTSDSDSDQTITIVEGDWLVTGNSSVSFKYTDYDLDTFGGPNNILSVQPTNTPDAFFDIDNLDQMGYVSLANLRDDYDNWNSYMSPLLNEYGYIDPETGERRAGVIGAYWSINDQDFSRSAFQVSFDHYAIWGGAEHEIHIGLRRTEDVEDLIRSRNGWGFVDFLTADWGPDATKPIEEREFIEAEYLRGEAGGVVHSEYVSTNIEINDNITWGKWNANVGVLLSNDELYGQDLEEDSSAVSGFRISRGSDYKMYETDFMDMFQPRLGLTRTIGDGDAVYASIAWYNPPATSLPRAASWARNYHLLRTRNYFNINGELLRTRDVSSSSGKFFQPDMDPRRIEEYIIGYSNTMENGLVLKTSVRHRYAHHFWEDTNNEARAWYGLSSPAGDGEEIAANGPYIPELPEYRAEIGGSSYVIAELDGAFTRYYEANVDVEKVTERYYFKGSYTWSHYYGNFDQDGTSGGNDANIFVGSSNIADGAGRQLWDYKYGDLRGDRRHMMKLYGTYKLPWESTLGVFAFWQDGEPWETWDVEIYREFTGSSSSTYRHSEPAGSRRSPDHYQLDVNYTHEFRLRDRYNIQLDLDIFNLFDKQTGRDYNPYVSSSTFGEPRSYWAPRRIQFAARFQF